MADAMVTETTPTGKQDGSAGSEAARKTLEPEVSEPKAARSQAPERKASQSSRSSKTRTHRARSRQRKGTKTAKPAKPRYATAFERGTRSFVMSQIRGKNTKPEQVVRSYLFARGLRFRKNDKRYPGHPDVVLPKWKTVVFVNGCFWHLHPGCKYARIPKSNVDFWTAKLARNRERDAHEQKELKELGWHVLVVWECELRPEKREATLERLYGDIVGADSETDRERVA